MSDTRESVAADAMALCLERPPAGIGARLATAFIDALGRRLVAGELTVRHADGTLKRYRGDAPGPSARLELRGPGTARRMLMSGAVGFADAFIAGDCDTPDLPALLELAAVNGKALAGFLDGRPAMRALGRLAHVLRPNTRGGSKRNIAAHYDLGNEFYGAWLDDSMTYSSAVYESPEADLGAAQAAKYRRTAEAAGIRRGDRVLEIGCGWGGFARYAGADLGCEVTALTISDAQYRLAAERMRGDGLSDRVRVLKQDYRDHDGLYDRIVSIEMFEAVGERYWPVFFERVRRNLAPDGRAALQIITIADEHWQTYRRRADFIQRYIFPGGMLPSPTALRQQVERAGLAVESDVGFGPDYARTLAEWRHRFEAAWPRIAHMGFDERFRRMWTYYLAYCEAGFNSGRLDVRRMALRHP